jgi:hypothetical protein
VHLESILLNSYFQHSVFKYFVKLEDKHLENLMTLTTVTNMTH